MKATSRGHKLCAVLGKLTLASVSLACWYLEVEGEEEYIVEEILDSHLRHNELEFLVKWEGYTNENN